MKKQTEINVQFIHPTNGKIISVELDIEITPYEIINELIACDFIDSNPAGHGLALKGGNMLELKTTIANLDQTMKKFLCQCEFLNESLATILVVHLHQYGDLHSILQNCLIVV